MEYRIRKSSVIRNLKLVISHSRGASSRSAFTLIEMLVVVAMTAIFATMGFVFLGSYRGSQNLKKTLDEVASLVQATQKRSITQDNGSQWNVRFSNTTSSGSQYSTFSGASFSTSSVDRTYGLARGIVFSNPFSSSTYDALFAPITGVLPEKKIISMIDGRGDSLVSDLVLSSTGRTTKRSENGLVGYWHLDEGTSTVANDASGGGNAGAFNGIPSWQSPPACVAGQCLYFNGTSDRILAGNADSLKLTKGTIEAWIKTPDAGTAYRGIVAKQGAYGMFLVNNYFGFYSWSHGWLSSGVTLNDNAWHHVACAFNSGVTNGTFCYVDGQLKLTTTMAVAGQTVGLQIAEANASQYFAGSIDEVRVYNRMLSVGEIASQYGDLK